MERENFKITLEPEKAFYSNGREVKYTPVSAKAPGHFGIIRRLKEIEKKKKKKFGTDGGK